VEDLAQPVGGLGRDAVILHAEGNEPRDPLGRDLLELGRGHVLVGQRILGFVLRLGLAASARPAPFEHFADRAEERAETRNVVLETFERPEAPEVQAKLL